MSASQIFRRPPTQRTRGASPSTRNAAGKGSAGISVSACILALKTPLPSPIPPVQQAQARSKMANQHVTRRRRDADHEGPSSPSGARALPGCRGYIGQGNIALSPCVLPCIQLTMAMAGLACFQAKENHRLTDRAR